MTSIVIGAQGFQPGKSLRAYVAEEFAKVEKHLTGLLDTVHFHLKVEGGQGPASTRKIVTVRMNGKKRNRSLVEVGTDMYETVAQLIKKLLQNIEQIKGQLRKGKRERTPSGRVNYSQ